MKALVVANRAEANLGTLGELLASCGFFVSRNFREDLQKNLDPVRFDLVVHLGSSWSLAGSNPQNLPLPVKNEFQMMRVALDVGLPVVGICFGAQLMSLALGGTVKKNLEPEIGWTDVRSLTQDAFLEGRWMQWHFDGIFGVPSSVRCAENENGTQAIKIGRALGVQFHPEANEEQVRDWIDNGGRDELLQYKVCPDQLIEITKVQSQDSEIRFKALMKAFLDGPP